MDSLKKFDIEFNDIILDNTSGSIKVLEKLTDLLEKILTSGQHEVQLKEYLMGQVERVQAQHQDLIVIEKFSINFLKVMLEHPSARELQQWLIDYKTAWENVHHRMLEKLIQQVDFDSKTILLHSYSQTVVEVLKYLKTMDYDFNVIQTESRPMFEGRRQASRLYGLGINVQLIIDLDIGKYIRDTDIVLLGADQYDGSYFLNKTGSLALVMIAEYTKKSIYILADTRKKVQSIRKPQKAPSGEVWKNSPVGIEIENYYFEKVPLKLVTTLIDEL